MTNICTGSPCQPLTVNSRTSPSACRASSARFIDSICRSPLPSPRAANSAVGWIVAVAR